MHDDAPRQDRAAVPPGQRPRRRRRHEGPQAGMQVGHLGGSSCVSAVNELMHMWHKAGMLVGHLDGSSCV